MTDLRAKLLAEWQSGSEHPDVFVTALIDDVCALREALSAYKHLAMLRYPGTESRDTREYAREALAASDERFKRVMGE